MGKLAKAKKGIKNGMPAKGGSKGVLPKAAPKKK